MPIRFEKETVRRLQSELKLAQQLNNLRLYRRIWALLLIHERRCVADIAAWFRVSEKTIYEWLTRFIVERFSWLGMQHYRGRGRKPHLTRHQKQRLYELVEKGPEAAGFTCGVWNSAMIVELIQKAFLNLLSWLNSLNEYPYQIFREKREHLYCSLCKSCLLFPR